MAYFPQTLIDLQSYISGLINDPTNTRYSLATINSQLDIAQHRWNAEARICRWTDYITPTANVYRYPISTNLTLFPIQILRVAYKGQPLIIRSVEYFDKYSATDWTTSIGTPQDFCIDLNSNNATLAQTGPSFILHPTPQAGDVTPYTNNVGISNLAPLAIEYLAPHTPMSSDSDTPFTVNTTYTNTAIIPYLAGLGLDVAASILEPDPTKETVSKARLFRSQANAYMSMVVQLYRGLEEDAPFRMSGGRTIRPGMA